ncbi:MAG: glycoside hydrolase family 38 C-terminal domain-containing protein [Dehalococcoidales bacterium]|nr:glycoside hydrolase family 38 C-terminal domain-containing protein [Dehalococcoidales bacterium]
MDKIYLVPHSHYDAVWALTKEDYFYINIDLIIKQALDLVENRDYKFLIEQTALLEEIERRNPHLFNRLAKCIKAGKIEIAGGEYLMADTMIPNGETLVREIMLGKRYAREKFGTDVPVMWGADSFGYNAQMPQIYRKSGYKYFAFRRGANRDKPSEFWWQGLDGTRILSHWMPLGYRAGLDFDRLEENFKLLKDAAATRHILMPSGSGSIPPQTKIFRVVNRWNKNHQDSQMKIATVSGFFTQVGKSADKLKTCRGELYSGRYSQVFPNTTSSRIWIKQELRKYENLLLTCERWASVSWLLGIPYPNYEFRNSWQKVLWGAFHDVAPGTGMDEGYEEARDNFSYLQNHLQQFLQNFCSIISQNLQVQEDVIVFNPLSWEVKNWVEVEMGFDRGKIKRIGGLRSGREETEVEILDFSRYADDSYQTVKLGFVATVPALGYRTYKIIRRNPRDGAAPRIIISGNTIENQFFKVRVNPANGLIDVFQDGKRLVNGNELVMEEEIGDLYYHRENLGEPLGTEGGEEGVTFGQFRTKSFKIVKTPLRRVIEVESEFFSLRWPYRLLKKLRPLIWRHKYLSMHKRIIIYNDVPRIDFITNIDNRHPQVRMRMRFSTNIKSPNYQSETQFGVIARPVDQYYKKTRDKWVEQPSGVYPALHWVDYSDKDRGITLINKGLPSHEIRDGNIYLTLLRSILMLASDGIIGPAIPTPDAQEFKHYTFEYALFPHQKGWKDADSFKPAYEFNYGLSGFQLPVEKRRKGSLPYRFSFVEVKPESLILVVFKKAEDSDEIILRLFETKGKKTSGVITLYKEPSAVKTVNLLEVEEGDIKHRGRRIVLQVKPFEIVSLKIKF